MDINNLLAGIMGLFMVTYKRSERSVQFDFHNENVNQEGIHS